MKNIKIPNEKKDKENFETITLQKNVYLQENLPSTWLKLESYRC